MHKNMILEKIEAVVGKTWFDVEVEGSRITLYTRDNGNVGDEEPGDEDIKEAQRITNLFSKNASYGTADEWVNVNLNTSELI